MIYTVYHIDNIIEQISDLPNLTNEWSEKESVNTTIMRIIYDELRPIISNAVVLWDNSIGKPIIENEFYPKEFKFNYTPYFEDNIALINKCIYPIKGKDAVLEYRDYLKSAILSWHSICALPIFNKCNNRKGVIILLSYHDDIPLLDKQVDRLQRTINETLSLYADYSFIVQLSDFTDTERPEKTLSNKYDILSKALKIHKNNIKHFSIWKIDDISDDNFNVIKEKSQHFEDIENEKHQTYKLNSLDNRSHRIIDYVNNSMIGKGIRGELKKGEESTKTDRKKISVSKYIKYATFTEQDINPNSCFTEEYCEKSSIVPNETEIIYIPIVPIRLNVKTDTINVLCLYINNRHDSIFKGSSIISIFSRKVYESLTLHNQLIRNDTTNKVLEVDKDGDDYYFSVAEILRNKNQCTGCYIYMKEKIDYLRMVIGTEKKEEEENASKVISEKKPGKEIVIDKMRLQLPKAKVFYDDSRFREFLEKSITGEINPNIEQSSKKRDYYLHYGDYPKEPDLVYSAILIPIRDKKQDFAGFVLFTNKYGSNGSTDQKFSPYFSAHNESIVSPSIESIYRYKLLQDSIKNKDILLRKIRHEIPHEVNLINKQAKEIKDYFIEQKKEEEAWNSDHQLLEKYSRKISVTNQLALSNTRIELIANFATSVNFTEREILKKRKTLNFTTYINSVKDIFREEAKSKGIDIKFNEEKANYNIEKVSRFYELAIHNIIFNAIRYSRFGTCVEVSMSPGTIEIINYGIGIKPEEKDKIYEENYRGDEAIKFTEDGLGFGLYLAKKVIQAHKNQGITHKLTHQSTELYECNYAGISSFCNFLDSSPNGCRLLNEFIKDDALKVNWLDYQNFRTEMNARLMQSKYKHNPINKETVSNFIKKEFIATDDGKQNNFDEFRKLFLECNVYKTIFTIKIS
ncbi:hypothetical protein AGMMS49965_02690 [Bacteroidia bacterium]|nr:hypothetical protein AGMMS49965_02690 [Bacteroidia bacterium]